MLNIGKLAGVDSVDYYLSQVASGVEDYYSGDGEAPGYWTGTAAAHLDVDGLVDAETLRRVLGGRDANGEPLPGIRSSRGIAAYDLAFRAPKSVSLLWAFGGTNTAAQVRDAHDAAVGVAVGYLEEHAGWSRRGAGGRYPVKARGFVAAAFRHRASRDRDPLLHSHVLVANAVQVIDDGRWGTIDSTRLYGHAKTAGYLYQTQLRHELTRRLGVAWEPVVNGTADLTGVPDAVIRAFSQRRQAIEHRLAERGETSRAAAEIAALATRKPKGDVDAVSLAAEWLTRAAALGFTPDHLTRLLGRARLAALRPAVRRRLVDGLLSPAGLTAHAATFTRRDVVQALCERVGGYDVDAVGVQALAGHLTEPTRSPFIPLDVPATQTDDRDGGGGRPVGGHAESRYTTPEVLAAERQVFATALRRRTDGVGTARPDAITAALTRSPRLSSEQEAMVHRLCRDGAGVAVVVGKAGSGKTAALAAAHNAWRASGLHVVGCALAGRAAQELQTAAGIPSHTIDRLLAWLDTGDPRGRLTARSVLVVDEAGMVDTRTLARLARHTTRARAKLVVVGDHHQLPEIGAGGAFRGLVDRLDPIALSTNRRQHHAWERAALDDLRDGDPARAVRAYAEHGRIATADSLEALREQLVDDWWHTTRTHGPDAGVMIALRVADVDALNQHARQRLANAGMLTGPPITAAGRTFQTGDRVVARRNQRLPTVGGASAQVMNGQRGTLTATDTHTRTVNVQWDRRSATVVPADYLDAGHLDHGYAITGHRVQGLTVDHTWTHTSDTTYREWGYVAASRGRRHNQIYATADGADPAAAELDHGAWQPDAATATQHLASRLGRSRAHRTATDAPTMGPTDVLRVASNSRRVQSPTSELDHSLGLD